MAVTLPPVPPADGRLASLVAYVRANLQGVGHLLRFDPAGFRHIDTSWAGARLSFLGAVLSAPAFALLQWLDPDAARGLTDKQMTAAIIAYVMQWALLPLVLYYLCNMWQRLPLYPRFVASLNWMTVWQSWIYVVILGLARAGILPPMLLQPISGVLLIYLFAVEGFIAQQALGVSIMGAVGIVILDLFLVWQITEARLLVSG